MNIYNLLRIRLIVFAYVILFLVFLLSCNRHQQAFNNSTDIEVGDPMLISMEKCFDTLFADNKVFSRDSVMAYVILPGTGCPGCISNAETLLSSYIKNKYPVRFVLTNVISRKILKMKLGDSIALSPNVYIDERKLVLKQIPMAKQPYPMIIYVNDKHHLFKYEFSEPENPESVKHLYEYLAIKPA